MSYLPGEGGELSSISQQCKQLQNVVMNNIITWILVQAESAEAYFFKAKLFSPFNK